MAQGGWGGALGIDDVTKVSSRFGEDETNDVRVTGASDREWDIRASPNRASLPEVEAKDPRRIVPELGDEGLRQRLRRQLPE
jgi:hypothetical protein